MAKGELVLNVLRRQKNLTKLLKCLKCKGYTEVEEKWDDENPGVALSGLVLKNQIVLQAGDPDNFNFQSADL